MSIKLPDGYSAVHLEEVDSTMMEAGRRASDLSGPTWILADRQTQSRGRRGRAWANPEGNFSATLFMRPDCAPQNAALRSFVASIALYFTLADLPGIRRLELKWPNDVLLHGRKVAGILLESSSSRAGQVDWLSIGIGVNLISAPGRSVLEERALSPISVVGAGGPTISPAAFLEGLARHFDHWKAS